MQDNLYVLVEWPESQELFNKPYFNKCDFSNRGASYFVPLKYIHKNSVLVLEENILKAKEEFEIFKKDENISADIEDAKYHAAVADGFFACCHCIFDENTIKLITESEDNEFDTKPTN
jgi:hypothetical protein